jgi:hypothetical protein
VAGDLLGGRPIVKKLALVAVVAVFLGYWMFEDPSGLAKIGTDVAALALEGVQQLFGAIIGLVKQFAG